MDIESKNYMEMSIEELMKFGQDMEKGEKAAVKAVEEKEERKQRELAEAFMGLLRANLPFVLGPYLTWSGMRKMRFHGKYEMEALLAIPNLARIIVGAQMVIDRSGTGIESFSPEKIHVVYPIIDRMWDGDEEFYVREDRHFVEKGLASALVMAAEYGDRSQSVAEECARRNAEQKEMNEKQEKERQAYLHRFDQWDERIRADVNKIGTEEGVHLFLMLDIARSLNGILEVLKGRSNDY